MILIKKIHFHPNLEKIARAQKKKTNSKDKEADSMALEDVDGSGVRHNRVTAIVIINGGFACACGPDKIFLFQKSESIHEFYIQVLKNYFSNSYV